MTGDGWQSTGMCLKQLDMPEAAMYNGPAMCNERGGGVGGMGSRVAE